MVYPYCKWVIHHFLTTVSNRKNPFAILTKHVGLAAAAVCVVACCADDLGKLQNTPVAISQSQRILHLILEITICTFAFCRLPIAITYRSMLHPRLSVCLPWHADNCVKMTKSAKQSTMDGKPSHSIVLVLVLLWWSAEKQSFNCLHRFSICQAGSWRQL